MRKAVPERAQGRPIEVWFQDEARVGQQGTLTRIWARRGTRPRGLRDRRYAWAYLFGAVCPERAIGAGLVLPHANAEAMSLHLAEISRHVAQGAHAVLVLDGAGWHGAANLAIPDNLTLLPLPPYSPELVWGCLCQALVIAAPPWLEARPCGLALVGCVTIGGELALRGAGHRTANLYAVDPPGAKP